MTSRQYLKVIDHDGIRPYPDLCKHQPKLAAHSPSYQVMQGDDEGPKNVVSEHQLRKTICNVALVSAGDGEKYSPHTIDTIRITFDGARDCYTVELDAVNTRDETLAMSAFIAKPAEVMGEAAVKMVDRGTGIAFESKVQTLKNEEAARLNEALIASKDHTAAMNSLKADSLSASSDKVPSNTLLTFSFTMRWKGNQSWMQGFGLLDDGQPFEYHGVQMLLPQPRDGWYEGEPTPIAVKVIPPPNSFVALPDTVAAMYEQRHSPALQSNLHLYYAGGDLFLPEALPMALLNIRFHRIRNSVESMSDTFEMVNVSDLTTARGKSVACCKVDGKVIHVVDLVVPEEFAGKPAEVINLEVAVDRSASMFCISEGNKGGLSNRLLATEHVIELLTSLQERFWPQLKARGVADKLLVKVRAFTTTCQNYNAAAVDIEDSEAVNTLIEHIKSDATTGGTCFVPFLESVWTEAKERDGPTVLVICSDGGCFKREDTLRTRQRLVDKGVSITTFGFGSFVSQQLMDELATERCELIPHLDDDSAKVMARNTLEALVKCSRRVEMVLEGASLVTVQPLGRTTAPDVSKALEKATFKVVDKIVASPHDKLRLTFETSAATDEVTMRCDDGSFSLLSAVQSVAEMEPLQVLKQLDHQWATNAESIIIANDDKRISCGTAVALKQQLNSTWTTRIEAYECPQPTASITPIGKADDSQYIDILKNNGVANPFIAAPWAGLYVGAWHGADGGANLPKYRSCNGNRMSSHAAASGGLPPTCDVWLRQKWPLGMSDFTHESKKDMIGNIEKTLLQSPQCFGKREYKADADDQYGVEKLVKTSESSSVKKWSQSTRCDEDAKKRRVAVCILRTLCVIFDVQSPFDPTGDGDVGRCCKDILARWVK